MADIALLILRGFGALWIAGALLLLREMYIGAQLDRMIDALDRAAGESGAAKDDLPARDDKGRERWLLAGGVLTFACGIAMLAAHRAAPAALALLIVQQMLYFVRQRRRERAAVDEADALEQRPSRQAVNAFYTTLALAVLAGWLYGAGKLG